jgi:outer membrane protein OmpA-like peptidoglycan-associated protein
MKKMSIIFLIIMFSGSIYAQSPDFGTGITFKKLFLDYQSQNGGDIIAFKDYRHGFEIGVFTRITDGLNIYIPGKFGVVQDSIDKTYRTLMGGDALLQYHFLNNGGYIIPYLQTGVGFTRFYNGDNDFQIPIGLGLNFRATDRIYVNVQSEYRVSLNLEKNSLNHALGFIYTFGGPRPDKKPVKKLDIMLIDSDGDGVPDHLDLCPQEPGLPEFHGCPDSDGDGIPDHLDACPDVPGLPEFNGCPDTDGDGIPDHLDDCPNEPGPAATRGCPDRDGDGIPDHLDDCPDVPGPAATRGCPDRDGDGVPDHLDKCPDKPGPAIWDGCPDSDGDGIPDHLDECPDEPGPVWNKGCPEIESKDVETLDIAMRAVQFDLGKATLKPVSFEILNQIRDILLKYPSYNLVISGHTDNTGSAPFNQKLSEDRARACYDYLITRGVSPRRLSSVGYGESRPIASNDTEAGRTLNRRVEFRMVPAGRR